MLKEIKEKDNLHSQNISLIKKNNDEDIIFKANPIII